ncbi:MAG: phenylacetate--CoA ligase family protein [Cyclobacteriaceae bacterium]|nr:phenylacetate--CoA ligase family protein [Cyclobacteriaceae bacterium]
MSTYTSLLENIILPLGDFILGTKYISELKKWREIQWLSEVELLKKQEESLKHILLHSRSRIPYYKDLKLNDHTDPYVWLKQFPLLTKEILKSQSEKLINPNNSQRLIKESSSGSSGFQSTIYMTKAESSMTQAMQTLLWEWSGYRPGLPLLQLGMTLNRTLVKRIKDKLFRTIYQQAFNINEHEVAEALKFSSRRELFFGGYASGLYSYALLAEKLGIKVSFNGVISWGDKMFPHYRKKIEEVFATKVFDTYGNTEGFVIAGQCTSGQYHILSPHVYLELLDKNGNEVAPGEMGYVVATRLDAYAMPLIRYYLGDLAVREESDSCECGRKLPILRQIIGRDTDIVRTRKGKFLIVHFFTGIFEHFPSIKQFRVVQRNLDGIEIEYIPERDFDKDLLNKISSIIEANLGDQLPITFRVVDSIPNTPSGKPQIILSELK